MSNSGSAIKNDPIREIAAGSLTTSYQVLGGVQLRDSFRYWITNDTNGDIYLSTDGVTDMMKFPSGTARAADNKTNDFFRAAGTQWWIRFATAPGAPAGWAAVEVEYA